MREKIAKSIEECRKCESLANCLIALLREEIRKVGKAENPDDLLPLHDTRHRNYWQDGFENCRQKILALLENQKSTP